MDKQGSTMYRGSNLLTVIKTDKCRNIDVNSTACSRLP